MALDDALIGFVGAQAFIRGLDGGLEPLTEPFTERQLRGFNILVAVHVVQKLGQPLLGVTLGPLNCEPLLHPPLVFPPPDHRRRARMWLSRELDSRAYLCFTQHRLRDDSLYRDHRRRRDAWRFG